MIKEMSPPRIRSIIVIKFGMDEIKRNMKIEEMHFHLTL